MDHTRTQHWVTYPCLLGCESASFNLPSEYRTHISKEHLGSIPEAGIDMTVKLSAQPRLLTSSSALRCPLCDDEDVVLRSEKQYQRHVGRHQEQLSLFALAQTFPDSDEGSDSEGESESDGHQSPPEPEVIPPDQNRDFDPELVENMLRQSAEVTAESQKLLLEVNEGLQRRGPDGCQPSIVAEDPISGVPDGQEYFGSSSPIHQIDSQATYWSPFQQRSTSPSAATTAHSPTTSFTSLVAELQEQASPFDRKGQDVASDEFCDICGYRPKGDPKWFKGSIAKHKKLQHSGEPATIYKCPYPGCTSQYKNRPDNLRQHQIERNHWVDKKQHPQRA